MLPLLALVLAACFGPPQPVAIVGYSDHAMEPFIARDGQTLFFNNRNDPPRETDLHWAVRIDNTHFRYQGPITSANWSDLDGVASLSRDGIFAYISPRLAEGRAATIWTGRWTGQRVEAQVLNHALAPGRWPAFNMDAEISASGAHLYFTDNIWAPGAPRTSDLRLAVHQNGAWGRAREFDRWFVNINTRSALEYAPATSENELELYFTRLTRHFLQPLRFETFVATRESTSAPFGAPERIGAISGVAEAPSVAPDGALYFHAMVDGRFTILRTPRDCPASDLAQP
jgi:hypothetical protein